MCALTALLFSLVFLLGIATEFNLFPRPHTTALGTHSGTVDYDFPDFNKIVHHYTLSESEIGLDNPIRRLMFVGDVHGMNKSLHDLLSAVSYKPETDTLIFAGDIMAKSTHAGSLAVLDFITQHKCGGTPGPVYAVRGNHDQMVVQWRAWRDWFEPLQLTFPEPSRIDAAKDKKPDRPVRTGREFLRLIEHEWMHDVRTDPKSSADPNAWADTARKRAAGTWRAEWWRRIPHFGKGREKKDWAIFGDHYWLAREMTMAQRECLYSLPLVIHAPSEHFFVVHAGILPSDPTLPLLDEHQPLAHPPVLDVSGADVDIEGDDDDITIISRIVHVQQLLSTSTLTRSSPRKNETLEELRTAQEKAIMTDIPTNRDPWVLLNMRGVRKTGKVTRNNDKGTPWSKIWNNQIGRCRGFDNSSSSMPDAPRIYDIKRPFTRPNPGDDSDSETILLPCEPASVVYGHAATRGLDVKRWSVGIDTGCLYGWRLTTLILQRPNGSDIESRYPESEVDDDGVYQDEDNWYSAGIARSDGQWEEPEMPSRRRRRKTRRVEFGDKGSGLDARLVSIKCPKMGDFA
ncbi:Metallo-dependent phosphatase [Laetiporus sulphureus 93-53]|uniref:Metallo-dependent phosphatase n=1 Tax=Laetiporus sulphureus 93-53 TaxID=1314785 RepID=A0A165CC83_9APHY|nr:Metallo-dependent phosphatase [Laetiporus sulphureus 93-53]KZT02550.1 Metallo-dependent phosphatase [Laetiporus sulphureus 93-53]